MKTKKNKTIIERLQDGEGINWYAVDWKQETAAWHEYGDNPVDNYMKRLRGTTGSFSYWDKEKTRRLLSEIAKYDIKYPFLAIQAIEDHYRADKAGWDFDEKGEPNSFGIVYLDFLKVQRKQYSEYTQEQAGEEIPKELTTENAVRIRDKLVSAGILQKDWTLAKYLTATEMVCLAHVINTNLFGENRWAFWERIWKRKFSTKTTTAIGTSKYPDLVKKYGEIIND